MKLTQHIKFFRIKILKMSKIDLGIIFKRQMLQITIQVQGLDKAILNNIKNQIKIRTIISITCKETTYSVPFLVIFLILIIKNKDLIPITIIPIKRVHNLTITVIKIDHQL